MLSRYGDNTPSVALFGDDPADEYKRAMQENAAPRGENNTALLMFVNAKDIDAVHDVVLKACSEPVTEETVPCAPINSTVIDARNKLAKVDPTNTLLLPMYVHAMSCQVLPQKCPNKYVVIVLSLGAMSQWNAMVRGIDKCNVIWEAVCRVERASVAGELPKEIADRNDKLREFRAREKALFNISAPHFNVATSDVAAIQAAIDKGMSTPPKHERLRVPGVRDEWHSAMHALFVLDPTNPALERSRNNATSAQIQKRLMNDGSRLVTVPATQYGSQLNAVHDELLKVHGKALRESEYAMFYRGGGVGRGDKPIEIVRALASEIFGHKGSAIKKFIEVYRNDNPDVDPKYPNVLADPTVLKDSKYMYVQKGAMTTAQFTDFTNALADYVILVRDNTFSLAKNGKAKNTEKRCRK